MNTADIAANTSGAWAPTQAEVAAIVLEMRPIIDRLVERDRRLAYAS